jgi:pre-rRNA-processing protein TSR4
LGDIWGTPTRLEPPPPPAEDLSIDVLSEALEQLDVQTSPDLPSFPSHYIYIAEEENVVDQLELIQAKYKDLIQQHAPQLEEGGEWKGEEYEKGWRPKGYDKAFQHFCERVADHPTQCIRYDWNGTPLLYTHSDSTAHVLVMKHTTLRNKNKQSGHTPMSKCGCGAERVFECQLMPNMLSVLEVDNYTGMEWGTILVYTCERDCTSSGEPLRLNQVDYCCEEALVQVELY